MARTHKQLNQAERRKLARLQAEGRSARQIAAALDRAPSTITRELKRNARADGSYDPGGAQRQTRAHCMTGLPRLAAGARRRTARAGAGHARRGAFAPAGRRAARARSREAGDLA